MGRWKSTLWGGMGCSGPPTPAQTQWGQPPSPASALPLPRRVMLKNCRDQCRPIFRHLQNLLQYHQLQWREVPAMAFYLEVGVETVWGGLLGRMGPLPPTDRHSSQLWSCQGHHEDDTCPQKIFRKYIRSKQPKSRELALRGLRNLYAGRMQLLLPDALLWLQDMRADIKLQAIHLLQDIAAQHPASIRGVLSQLAVQLLSCFNEVRDAGQRGAFKQPPHRAQSSALPRVCFLPGQRRGALALHGALCAAAGGARQEAAAAAGGEESAATLHPHE